MDHSEPGNGPHSGTPPLDSRQFSLRSVFIALTVLCILLGVPGMLMLFFYLLHAVGALLAVFILLGLLGALQWPVFYVLQRLDWLPRSEPDGEW